MSEWFKSDFSDIEQLNERLQQYGAGSGQVVDEVLHGEGAEAIKEKIAPLIPSSGRTWSGKHAAASSAMPGSFQQDNGQLSVTIAARGTYHYLYFPDDGSNTRKHAGNKQFMMHGAEQASEQVIEKCVQALIENFEGGT